MGDRDSAARRAGADSATSALTGALVERVLSNGGARGAHAGPAGRAPPCDFPEIIGRSPNMVAALDAALRAAPQNVSVLLHGESGVGKELFARAIHRLSPRAAAPFIAENCAALPDTLFEAEFFGAEKGSYTGADRMRRGLLERSDHGTLFLDEVAELSLSAQSKLLRALQEREFRRLGGSTALSTDFRLITATHRDLEQEVKAGRFRADLFFRIQVMAIRIPPLRERREDLPIIAHHILRQISARRAIAEPAVESEALEALARHDWPGNIRELQNELERAITLTPECITSESLSPQFRRTLMPYSISRRVREEVGVNLGNLERMVLGGVIRDVLEETQGNKTHAARLLGIPKANLYRRLEKYGISVPVGSGGAGAPVGADGAAATVQPAGALSP